MKQIGAFQAKTHFSELLKAVSEGQSIMITRRGEPMALLTPPQKKHPSNVKALINDLRKWRELIEWGDDLSIAEAKAMGRK